MNSIGGGWGRREKAQRETWDWIESKMMDTCFLFTGRRRTVKSAINTIMITTRDSVVSALHPGILAVP